MDMKIYKNCPKEYEADHTQSLIGRGVCGLHVPYNLQYLTKQDNRIKGNSFDGTVENISWKEK